MTTEPDRWGLDWWAEVRRLLAERGVPAVDAEEVTLVSGRCNACVFKPGGRNGMFFAARSLLLESGVFTSPNPHHEKVPEDVTPELLANVIHLRYLEFLSARAGGER